MVTVTDQSLDTHGAIYLQVRDVTKTRNYQVVGQELEKDDITGLLTFCVIFSSTRVTALPPVAFSPVELTGSAPQQALRVSAMDKVTGLKYKILSSEIEERIITPTKSHLLWTLCVDLTQPF